MPREAHYCPQIELGLVTAQGCSEVTLEPGQVTLTRRAKTLRPNVGSCWIFAVRAFDPRSIDGVKRRYY